MAFISPFKGVRYNTDKAGKLDDIITPPFDVINKHAEEAFRSRNHYNIIRLDLAKNPGKENTQARGASQMPPHFLIPG